MLVPSGTLRLVASSKCRSIIGWCTCQQRCIVLSAVCDGIVITLSNLPREMDREREPNQGLGKRVRGIVWGINSTQPHRQHVPFWVTPRNERCTMLWDGLAYRPSHQFRNERGVPWKRNNSIVIVAGVSISGGTSVKVPRLVTGRGALALDVTVQASGVEFYWS